MSNIIDLCAFQGARPPKRPRGQRISLRTLVFRAYHLIVEAPAADLARDVQLDPHKARLKLRKIREQIVLDRDRAAARAELLTKAEAKLTAAIDAAQATVLSTTTPAPVESRTPPRAPSSQERGDALLMRWRVERAAGIRPGERLSGDDPQ